jgi:hypothetical protein
MLAPYLVFGSFVDDQSIKSDSDSHGYDTAASSQWWWRRKNSNVLHIIPQV